MSEISSLRKQYHQEIFQKIVRYSVHPEKGKYPSFADGSSKNSIAIAWKLIEKIDTGGIVFVEDQSITAQTAGGRFEEITRNFLQKSLDLLSHLRVGNWQYYTSIPISRFDQYEHLAALEKLSRENPQIAATLGGDYIIKPDIIVAKKPVPTVEINRIQEIIAENDGIAAFSPFIFRATTPEKLILHASISCKWTLRSDRGQNARTEALNLIRNRKGGVPKIVAVTGEPLPMRIASLALGTGDLDCVYHFALPELQGAIEDLVLINESGLEDQKEMLNTLIEGRRLRDISDLPFDLLI
ncbi:MAG: NgoMIV family type II restriction endonuclease [Chloroflexota bacterium]